VPSTRRAVPQPPRQESPEEDKEVVAFTSRVQSRFEI
jgi:hypothetical protein